MKQDPVLGSNASWFLLESCDFSSIICVLVLLYLDSVSIAYFAFDFIVGAKSSKSSSVSVFCKWGSSSRFLEVEKVLFRLELPYWSLYYRYPLLLWNPLPLIYWLLGLGLTFCTLFSCLSVGLSFHIYSMNWLNLVETSKAPSFTNSLRED